MRLPICLLLVLAACNGGTSAPGSGATTPTPAPATTNDPAAPPAASAAPGAGASLPLVVVADADLPGAANRFDYQDIDAERGQLVIAHMNDASVVVVDLASGAVKKVIPNVPTARGVAIAPEVNKIFVTSSPDQVVVVDRTTLAEVGRLKAGKAPDGIAWDPVHRVVATSDQGDGAVSLLADAGAGARVQIPLGVETGNVVFDAGRNVLWITVVGSSAPDHLVQIDPVAQKATLSIPLPGCDGAHGLRIHPDGKSALVACEGNDTLARVNLDGDHAIVTAATGAGPDVLAIDPGLGWIYVAAESGDVAVFDIAQPGLVVKSHEHPGAHAHSVAVDAATHRVFFPLQAGPKGTPVLRIMHPG